jgi:Uma2 family endonuclease
MPDDGKRYEIVEGRLVVKAVPSENHAAATIEFVLLLGAAQRAGFGRAYTANFAVCLDFHGAQENDFLPDLMFICKERLDIISFRCVEGSPDLVIEILSPSTEHSDLGVADADTDKFAIYERFGVPHYWIADTETHRIAQFSLRDGKYGEPVILREGDVLGCALFPGVTMEVSQVFANMVERGKPPTRRSAQRRDPFARFRSPDHVE